MSKLTGDRYTDSVKLKMLLKCFQMAIIVSVLNKYFRRVASRRKMPQMCSEMSRNASHKSSVTSCFNWSRLVLPLVSGFAMDRGHAYFHSRPQSPSFLGHVVLRVLDFAHFGQESVMVFEGTTGVSLRRKRFRLLRYFSCGLCLLFVVLCFY